MIHWSWVVFGIVAGFLVYKIWRENNYGGGDYNFDLVTPLYVILLIIFILLWGGIFWW
jgi:hypothetical protein